MLGARFVAFCAMGVVFAFSTLVVLGRSGGKGSAKKLPKGISAWSYAKQDKDVVQAVKDYNKKAKPDNRFRYFFPYTGSLDFNGKGKAGIYYNVDRSSYYKRMGKDVMLLPIIDARDDKKKFRGWSDAEYKKLAQEVAAKIIKDRSAAGAQVDIEPFHPSHLPFYKHLREELNAKGKILTMFVSIKKDNVMLDVFKSCDILVLSGYDSAGENPGPAKYKKVLARNLSKLRRLAKEAGGKYMVGIPVAASWGEYEYKIDKKSGKRTDTKYKQVDYVKASLEVLKKEVESDPNYIGMALWVLSRVRKKDDPKAKGHQPDYIRDEVWKLLEKH